MLTFTAHALQSAFRALEKDVTDANDPDFVHNEWDEIEDQVMEEYGLERAGM